MIAVPYTDLDNTPIRLDYAVLVYPDIIKQLNTPIRIDSRLQLIGTKIQNNSDRGDPICIFTHGM